MFTINKTLLLTMTILGAACGAASEPDDEGMAMPPATTGIDDDDSDDPPPEGTTSSPDPDDEDEPGASSGDDDEPGPGDEPSSGSSSGDAPEPGNATDGEDPEVMACIEEAANDCEICACNNCLDQLLACQQDAGCVEIRMCAQETGCTGLDCLGACGDVIDGAGGPLGPSASQALMLSDCYDAMGCTNQC